MNKRVNKGKTASAQISVASKGKANTTAISGKLIFFKVVGFLISAVCSGYMGLRIAQVGGSEYNHGLLQSKTVITLA